ASIGRVTGRKVFVSDLGGGGWDISGYLSTDGWYHGHLHISEYSREVFGHAGKNWAHVIYGGVDTEKFCPAPDGIRTGNACYVGRILPHKGVDNLVEAMPTDMGLDVVGRPYHSEYYQLLRTLAEGKQIHFKTGADDADLVRTYQRALCVVLPSVYRTVYGDTSRVPELLGQTLLEGMACETPAICTDVASMPEVVEDGVTGFVVPPNDPATLRMRLIWLRDNPGRAREMGQAARQRVLQRFTWPAVVNRCMNIYRA
ncbi:MAG TPA: glycosyltransferase, partial [Bryobacteraceae bacterium]|nr:glycosyltransferase [Bryobacteraceae bacterium]